MVAIRPPDPEDEPTEVLLVGRDIRPLKARERALAAAEAKWRAAFDRAPIGMAKMDEDGYVIAANQAVADLLEASIDEVVGSHFLDYVPSGGRTEVEARMLPLLRGETSLEGDERVIVTRAGNLRWVNVHTSHLDATDDAPARTLFHYHDITDIKCATDTLAAARARFTALVEHSTDVTLITDTDGVVSYISPALHDMLDLMPVQVIGTRIRDRFHPDDLARARPALDALYSEPGAVLTYQTRIRHADGTWRHIEVTSPPITSMTQRCLGW